MKNAAVLMVSDEQLVNEYLSGNNNSLGKIYTRYFKKVYYKCFSFTKNTDEAYDMAQDILMKVFKNIHSFRGQSRFSTWLYAVTSNHCIAYTSKNKNLHMEEIGSHHQLYDDYMDMEERTLSEQKELIIDTLLNEISDSDKRMLTKKYQENYSIKQLQDEFNLSASAVKMRLQRARQRIGKLYDIQTDCISN
ncbi:MAG: RNA polymerase sigma factor [Bacteroidales bacterium]|nr:RNA polymerase sigma factor [Bacteroidales bacterium]